MDCESCEFKGVHSIGDRGLMNQLEVNLKYWFDWAFLKIGAWEDVDHTTPGVYGGDFSVLRLVTDPDPDYDQGQIWESCRKDWVWENDISYTNAKSGDTITPYVVEIKVDGSVVTNYIVNYPQGQIIFDTAIDVDSEVTAKYSSRQIQTYIANDTDWWNQLQFSSNRVDDEFFLQTDTGTWTIGSEKRIQMPTIIIEAVPRTRSTGLELGNGAMWVEQDVYCHVIAEDRRLRNDVMDALLRQFYKTIILFSTDAIATANDFPLNYRGEIEDADNTFPMLSSLYPYARCQFVNIDAFQVESINPKLFNGIVKMTCKVAVDD